MEKHEVKRKDGTVKPYDFISPFCNGFAAVKNGYKWGFINTAGDEICPIKYEFPMRNQTPGSFFEGYAIVGLPNDDGFLKFGYINTEGKEVCPFIYTAACDFKNGVAWVRNEDMKWLLINKEFKTLTKRTYDNIHEFFYGYAVVELNGKFGFINESGEEVCEIKYNYMSCFNVYGFAQIELPNPVSTTVDRIYWIDTLGKEYYCYLWSNELQPLS